jgi:predicted site-specific integrase-resolvase
MDEEVEVKKPEPEIERLAYRVNEFCRTIGISRAAFYVAVKAGNIQTVMIAGRRLVPTSEVDRLLGKAA